MHLCVAALEKCSSNGWFVRTALQIIEVRLIITCQTATELSLVSFVALFSTKEQLCTASDPNHAHFIQLPSTGHGEVSA